MTPCKRSADLRHDHHDACLQQPRRQGRVARGHAGAGPWTPLDAAGGDALRNDMRHGSPSVHGLSFVCRFHLEKAAVLERRNGTCSGPEEVEVP